MTSAPPSDLILVPHADYTGWALPAGFDWVTWPELDEATDAARVRFTVFDNSVTGDRYGLLARLPRLQGLQISTLGYDFVLAQGLPEGVKLFNAASVSEDSVAEVCLLGLLVSLRRYQTHYEQQRAHDGSPVWRRTPSSWRDEVRGLGGKRVALLGYGGVGKAIARRLDAFGATVEPYARTAREVEGVSVRTLAELRPLLPGYDIVIVALPGGPETRHLVDASFLAAMKEGAVLSNVGRGSIVETDALVAALRSERIAAALDVVDPEPLPADHPLYDCPNLVYTAHEGGVADFLRPRYLALVERQLRAFVAGREPANRVI